MKTLYVSDLDGTLLRSDIATSEYTNATINRLVENGMLFSYATARSHVTASKVTRGLNAKFPLIVYNGAFIIDNATGKILLSNYFGDNGKSLLDDLISHGIFPIVYAYIDGTEKFSYVEDMCSRGMKAFLSTRQGDPRRNPVKNPEDLYKGNIFYITCIDEADILAPFNRRYSSIYHTVYQCDIYSGEQWLEFMPPNASKANAIRRLMALLECDRLVVFGDGKNDIDMFNLADESYAVKNAVEELKAIATGIIGSNDEDAVAKWLSERQ
jgi:Cof subfamily protein (haloacid dehalogenase superfamily)